MATSNNPRKFSEKIALHNQKQAEETAAFEEVMKDLSITRAARVTRASFPPPPAAAVDVVVLVVVGSVDVVVVMVVAVYHLQHLGSSFINFTSFFFFVFFRERELSGPDTDR